MGEENREGCLWLQVSERFRATHTHTEECVLLVCSSSVVALLPEMREVGRREKKKKKREGVESRSVESAAKCPRRALHTQWQTNTDSREPARGRATDEVTGKRNLKGEKGQLEGRSLPKREQNTSLTLVFHM